MSEDTCVRCDGTGKNSGGRRCGRCGGDGRESQPSRSRSFTLQAASESLADYPAIVAMHEEQTERAEAEVTRLRAENERLREALMAIRGPIKLGLDLDYVRTAATIDAALGGSQAKGSE